MNWLDETVATYEPYESPTRFYYWSCLATVSAILKDRVFFDRFIYKLYPNIYVLLFGPSAIKKGPPISLARDIVNRVNNTRVINGRATVEAIIKELGTVQHRPNQVILNDSAGFIVSSELSSAIIGNTNSLDILTDLFDRIYNEGEWTYRLKNSEPIKLKNPTITWLAGTNEALFRDFVPEKNLKGGLIGRTFIIAEHKAGKLNSLMDRPEILPDRDKIAKGIEHLKNLSGEFCMAPDVRNAFKAWYHRFKTQNAPGMEDETGTVGRIDDNILKLAMIISCARRADLILTIDDIMEATKEVLNLIAPAKRIAISGSLQKDASQNEKRGLILFHLANKDQVSDTARNILRKFTGHLDHEDLDRIMTTLERAGVVIMNRAGGDVIYSLNLSSPELQEYVKYYQR